MNKDRFMRGALWASVPYNIGGAALFAFPSSVLGQLVGLPVPVPPLYGALLAVFVLLFAGAYAWLACQAVIHRPLVALAAIGKFAVFGIFTVFWLFGAAPGLGVLAATGDLALAVVFVWWLVSAQQGAPADGLAPAPLRQARG
jgi:hypothetical protein